MPVNMDTKQTAMRKSYYRRVLFILSILIFMFFFGVKTTIEPNGRLRVTIEATPLILLLIIFCLFVTHENMYLKALEENRSFLEHRDKIDHHRGY